MKPKITKQGNLLPIFSTDLLCGLQGAKSLLPEPLRRAGNTKSTQMDGITLSSFGFWAFLVGRGPGSFSRLAAMSVSHGPWHRYRGRAPAARLAPSWSRPCEHKLLFIPLRRLLSGLRVWRRTWDSQLSKEFSWSLNNMEHSVPLLQCLQPQCWVCPSHGWFSSKEYLLVFNNAVVYRHNLWLNRKHTGCRPSKEMINRLCLALKK